MLTLSPAGWDGVATISAKIVRTIAKNEKSRLVGIEKRQHPEEQGGARESDISDKVLGLERDYGDHRYLAIVTPFAPDWIEVVSGWDPDQHDGSVERLIVIGLCCVTALSLLLAALEWRRTQAAGSA